MSKLHAVTVSEPPASTVWFCFHGKDRNAEATIRKFLSADGIRLSDFREPACGNGILCFSEIDEDLFTLLRRLRSSQRLIIGLATSSAVIQRETTWRLLRDGAAEVLSWDSTGATVARVCARLERWGAIERLAKLAACYAPLAGESGTWTTLVRRVVDAAHFTNAPVLFIGETGTGKEVLARIVAMLDSRVLHQNNPPPDPVTVDCSTLSPELSGSELFGHERGAFTGAISSRDGAFALSNGGTLFLDEIGELPLPLQVHLLRAIQEKKYKRVGGNTWQPSDFRLVCATNRDLDRLVEQGQFRLDLYHRISGIVFRTIPLRERREDILPLACFFLKAVIGDDEPIAEFDPTVRDYLVNRGYPGNVRELAHLIQRMAHRHVGPGPITAGDIAEEDRPSAVGLQRAWPDEEFEKTITQAISLGAGLKEITQVTTETAIRIAVQSERGNLQRAAKKLGVTDRALQIRRATGRIPA